MIGLFHDRCHRQKPTRQPPAGSRHSLVFGLVWLSTEGSVSVCSAYLSRRHTNSKPLNVPSCLSRLQCGRLCRPRCFICSNHIVKQRASLRCWVYFHIWLPGVKHFSHICLCYKFQCRAPPEFALFHRYRIMLRSRKSLGLLRLIYWCLSFYSRAWGSQISH